ncbi:MAG TPA: aspartate kinase [Polyangiaceae bacterium]|nr:aspartate kinase [Polyangiaceae bacterium]
MARVVQKFGGSSLADLERLGRVADLVMATRRAGHDLCVVVSAMGKTTDSLLDLARSAARSGDAGENAEAPRRELDMLVSTGERVSMALLSIAIRARGGDAVSLTGSQSGILTNDRHFDARIVEVRPFRIEDELARGRIVIVAGYQGMSYRREITTLGRGGSDTTAVALAAALDAERCEIYSDVDGVYSADPRVVADARHLPEIDCDTMQEMAERGAKVLNARAVAWAKKHRVTILARRTSDFAASGAGRETRIVPERRASAERAVVGEKNVALVRAPVANAAALLAAAADAELELRSFLVEGDRCVGVVPLLNAPDFERARAPLAAAGGASATIERGLGVVSLVGVATGSDPGTLALALSALPCPAVHLTSSPLALSAVIPEARLPDAERAWHASFVGDVAPDRAA